MKKLIKEIENHIPFNEQEEKDKEMEATFKEKSENKFPKHANTD